MTCHINHLSAGYLHELFHHASNRWHVAFARHNGWEVRTQRDETVQVYPTVMGARIGALARNLVHADRALAKLVRKSLVTWSWSAYSD